MRKCNFYIILLALCSSFTLHAQVLGKVVNKADGTPLVGASITIRGTAIGTSTNADGNFNLNVATGKTLIISMVNFKSIEVRVAGTSPITVQLQEEEKSLQEVTVVAYGSQRKKDLTSSVSVVNSEQIRRQQVTSVAQALQGTAAGVLVVNNSGQPGDNPQIRIRGIASVNASAEPLIVVDGIPFNGNLNMINPNDVDNFSILKDANATALYGSRASNGVILITTKSGKKGGKPRITLNSLWGWSQRALPEYGTVNLQSLMELNWEGYRNSLVGTDANTVASRDLIKEYLYYNPYTVAEPIGTDGKLKSGLTAKWNTDWRKELTNDNAARRDINIGMSGGGGNNSYYLGMGYLKQDGYLITSQYKRASVRFNFTSDINAWLTTGFRSQYVYSDQNYPNQISSSFDNVVQYYRTMSPLFPVYMRNDAGDIIVDAKGNPVYDFGDPDPSRTYNQNRQTLAPSNLLATTLVNTERRQRHMTTANGFLEATFLPGLKARSNFGIDRYQFLSMSFQNPDFGNGRNVGGRLGRTIDGTTSWTWNNSLSYNKTINNHTIEAFTSYELYRYQFDHLAGQKTSFPFGGLYEFNAAANTESLNGYADNHAISSIFGRLKYNFKSRYFIEGTLRRDGSSRFEKSRRYGVFPSVGVAWVISDEAFMQNLSPKVSLLKLRASYGRVGNEALTSYFPYLGTFSTGYDNLSYPGVYFDQLANESISWEKQASTNVALDFGFFNGRISGSVEWFKKDAIDLLFKRPLVFSGGFRDVDFNIGDLTNTGIELTLNGHAISKSNFDLYLGANVTWIKNELKKLPQEKLLTNPYQQEVGKSIYEFFMPVWAGVDPADGKGMWYMDEMVNGSATGKTITTKTYSLATRKYQGSAIPKLSGGFNTKLVYKNLDLSALLNFALGSKYYDGNYAGLLTAISSSPGDILHEEVLTRWTKAGDITDVPKLDINNTDYAQTSTRYLFKGDYARLRNVTIGYNFNTKTKINFLESARLFLQADNMLTWSKLKTGADPEANIDGSTRQTTSAFKTISVGIDINF